jgi:AAA ATPase domain
VASKLRGVTKRAKQEGVTLLTGHFVGRADELGSLEGILDELDRGCPGAIELAGEPGIGKTRLLGELAARAEARGHLVLSGAASDLERDLPFSVFVDALDEYVEGLDPEQLATLDDDVQAELAHVFPSLWVLASGNKVALQHERYRSHRAVRALLEHLAQTRPRRPPHLRRRRCTQSTNSWSLISFAPPTYPDASASDTRSSGALSTRPPPAGGGLAPTSGARRRSRRGV